MNEISKRLDKLETELNALKGAFSHSQITAQSRQLWTIDDIAQYTGYSRGYIAQELVYKPLFPTPANEMRPNAKRLYFAGEIVQFFQQTQQQNREKQGG